MTGREEPVNKVVKPPPVPGNWFSFMKVIKDFISIGPGAYRPESGFDQISKTMQSAKSL